jgi:hypothetical protein
MSLEASKESRKQKALENLKKGRELRAKKLAEKNQPVVDEMSELDETPKSEPPKPIKKPRVKKVVDPVVETPKPEPPKPEPLPPPPIETPVVKPKKQYKPREPREPKQPTIVERVVERVVYAPPPLEIQFY